VSNPYQPPVAVLTEGAPPRKAAPVKAVIYGVLVDLGGSMVAGLLLLAIRTTILIIRGADPDLIGTTTALTDPTSVLSLSSFAIGFAFSFLGGYVCARVARRAELKCSAVAATLSTVGGLALGGAPYAAWVDTLLGVLSVGMVMFGGYVGALRNARVQAS
jgi:hypothetical protein